MNKDKIIKDLKEKNRKLKNQYELQEVRLYSSQHKVDELKEELKTTQEKWEKDKQFYKHRFEDYIEYKNRIDKTIEYIKSNEWATDYKLSSCRTHLLDILGDEDNE